MVDLPIWRLASRATRLDVEQRTGPLPRIGRHARHFHDAARVELQG